MVLRQSDDGASHSYGDEDEEDKHILQLQHKYVHGTQEGINNKVRKRENEDVCEK